MGETAPTPAASSLLVPVAAGGHGARVPGAARIGPNSVLQTLRALESVEGQRVAEAVAVSAGLVDREPTAMIPEAQFVRLVEAVRRALPPGRSEAVLRQSGWWTAEYVAAHRIPAPVRVLLRLLPARAGLPLLIDAFRRHAWTFAGAGRFAAEGRYPGVLVLASAPTCRGAPAFDGPHGAYYEAAFEGLLRLAAPRVRVREVACQAQGARACRFQLDLHAPGGDPCASS